MRHDEQKPDMRHGAIGEAAFLAETSFPTNRLYVDPAWVHRKHVCLSREIPPLGGKSAEAIVSRSDGRRAELKEKVRR
jgi:hypothetical protein